MKPRHLLMLTGLAVAAWLALFGDKSPGSGVAEPVARLPPAPPAIPAAHDGKGFVRSSTLIEAAEAQVVPGEAEVRILALQPRAELMRAADAGHGNDRLFANQSWAPPPVVAKLASPPPPSPPPSAPPLPFTYLGKQTSGGKMEVYLARGQEIFVVREQMVIQNTYRVESIRPPTLSLVYLPLNEIQRLSIGVTN